MFIQYWQQQPSASTKPILPLHIAPKKTRQITTDPSTWPITEPLSPDTKTARMGCGPSRPCRSFYNEYFVEQPKKFQNQQRANEECVSRPPRVALAPSTGARERRPVTIAEVQFAEEVARGDLKIYEEEVEARRREEGQRTFVMHAAVRGEQVFF